MIAPGQRHFAAGAIATPVIVVCCLYAWFAAPSARAQTGVSTLAEIANYSGPDRTERLVAGAKKEGSVNVYTSEALEDIAVLSAAFQNKYGVTGDRSL